MPRRSAKSESGYILLAVIFMVALVLIALAVAAPRIATDIQRDREAELIHRGKQYTRAIKLYYKKFGRYPSSIDQLENTTNIRFLRKRYTNPMTGKDDWKLVHFGEAHVKAMGLFGQPLQSGGLSATAGSSVLGGTPGLTTGAGGAPIGGAPGLLGSTSSGSSTFGGSTPSTGSTSSGISSTGTDSSSSSGSTSATSPGTTGNQSPGSSSPFGTGTGTSPFGSGQSLGGAPIVGVVIADTRTSIKEYKKQKHYNEWEFVYDPVEDLMSSVSLFGGGSGSLNGPGSTGTNSGGTGLSNPTNSGTQSSPFSSSPTSSSGPTTNTPSAPQ